jgi:EAL domain-containing protein (putative c-di-GMP-specific phosphodiesterase class I)
MSRDGLPDESSGMPTDRKTTVLAARVPARRRDRRHDLADAGARGRIVSLHRSGASAHTAAAALNGGGSRTVDGARWTANTVARVISDSVALTDDAGPATEETRMARRIRAVGELGQAITTGQLEVHYQPVVDMPTGDVASVEALVRWRHPTRGLVPPDQFIPLAETCGLMTELTEYVLRAAVAQIAVWAEIGLPLRCAVNVSAASLRDPLASAALVGMLRHHADAITVEVTESVLADRDTIAALCALADAGVDIAIDDFGTGYSCLATLKDVPATTLKIDRSFLRDVTNDPRAVAVVGAIVQLARSLGLDVVAEGVETEAVASLLRESGVRKAQGFLYARPTPPAELSAWLLGRALLRAVAS